MRLFKPTYKNNGKTKQVATWWLDFRDVNGILRKWGLRTKDKNIAELIKAQINSLNEWAKSPVSQNVPEELVAWVRRQRPEFRKKIEEAGLLPKSQIAQSKPIREVLSDYRNNLLGRNDTDGYAYQVESRIAKIIDGCGFRYWADVDGAKINEYIRERCRNGLSSHTGSQYLGAFKSFAKWMHAQGRISSIPAIQSVKFDTAPQRAFEFDEWSRLLEATRNGPVRFNLSGHERYVVYILAVETGLRRDELRSLTPASFDFKKCMVFVARTDTKGRAGRRKDAVQCITPETAALVKELAKGKMPNTRLFNITEYSAIMIRKDCEAAGIELENHKGKIKFHSLRHSCGSFLAAKGVHPKVAQQIMRHASIDLTMSHYTHVLRGSEAEAVNRLRGLGQEKSPKAETA